MSTQLYHRGPDAGDEWVESASGVALAHRRLSIIDLSAAGAQPMHAAGGRYHIVYNGEIYDFAATRESLAASGYPFKGHSDTEVLLAAIEKWGIARALDAVHGMFAFALWDSEKRELTLARDRAGKKPLYYGWCGNTFLFGSELKALRQHPQFDAEIDRDGLGQFIQYGWIPEPLSIYRRVRKLMPGSYITIAANTSPWSVHPTAFWQAGRVMEQAKRNLFTGSFEAAVDQLEAALTQSVTERMVADVDLGALLSGGIDSSTVVGIMQRHSERPVRTFSIGFEEKKYNEAEYAAAVARYLGTEHEELYVTPEDCLAVVDRLPSVYDEPFGDISQVPTLLVSQMASRQVKVVLSGDGGDETFAGYKHYHEGLVAWRRYSRLPHGARVLAADLLSGLGDQCWRMLRPVDPASVAKLPGWRKLGSKLQRKTRYWRAASPQALMASHFARTHRPGLIVPGAGDAATSMNSADGWATGVGTLPAMLQFDYSGYMVGDILVKVDRAAMACGLEVRSPILDTAVTEFAWTLPDKFLLDKSGGKRVLREVLARYVPTALTDRPKRGFGVPIDAWLRGPLRERVEDLISVGKLEETGYLDAAMVRRLWEQHLCGWRNHSSVLWSIIMFQEWHAQLH